MKKLFHASLKNLGVTLVVLLGLFLIAYSILKGSGLRGELTRFASEAQQLSKPSDELSGKPSNKGLADGKSLPDLPKPSLPKPSGKEVRNYVLFTSVPHGEWFVVTGIRYASTSGNKIDYQWCYLSDNRSIGGRFIRLQLATIARDGTKSIPKFSKQSLKAFNLTLKKVAAIILTRCRFVSLPSRKHFQKGKNNDKSHERNSLRRNPRPNPSGRSFMERCAYIPGRSKHHCAAFDGESL